MADATAIPDTDTPPRGLSGFFAKFTVLKGAMPELWLTFFIKFLVIAAYGLMNTTLVPYFESDFGLSDKQALGLVAVWSFFMSLGNVLSGSLTDAIGFRSTFFVGVTCSVFSRLVLAFTPSVELAVWGGLVPLAIGEAMTGPVLVAAARIYSNTKQRSISFSLIYSIMNVGFLAAHLLYDHFRRHMGEHGHIELAGGHLSTYRTLLLVSMVIDVAIFPLIFCLRSGAEATDEGAKITPKKQKYQNVNPVVAATRVLRDATVDTVKIFADLWRHPGFYQLIAFLILIAFLKLIYRQLDYVFPTFGVRVLGDGAPVGTLLAINDTLIIFLAPIVGALTQRFSAYRMVILGGAISAVSVYFMALPPAWFAATTQGPLGQWLGHSYLGLTGVVNPYYVMTAVFVIFLSIGEAFYSPRVYEYAASIAPKGKEASYSSLSYVPFLMAKMLTGVLSGPLLSAFCPAAGVRRPAIMWLVIGATATVAPLGLIVLGRVIRLHEAGRTD